MFHRGDKGVSYCDEKGVWHAVTVLQGLLDDVDEAVGRRLVFEQKTGGKPRLRPPKSPLRLHLRRQSDGRHLVMFRDSFDLVEVDR